MTHVTVNTYDNGDVKKVNTSSKELVSSHTQDYYIRNWNDVSDSLSVLDEIT